MPFLAALRYTETGLRKRADWEATWEKQRAEDAIDAEVAARRDEFLRDRVGTLPIRAKTERRRSLCRSHGGRHQDEDVRQGRRRRDRAEAKRRKQDEVGDIPVPPKYKTADFQSQDFWRLRGGLDVPKERFVSFPHCARDADPSLPDHLGRLRPSRPRPRHRRLVRGAQGHRRLAAERLKPLLAGLLELVPWLRQWHNDIDPETGSAWVTSFWAMSRSKRASSA